VTNPFANQPNPEEITRLRNGRYYYCCPGTEHTGRDRAHTRVTTFAKPAGDSYALGLYEQRKVIEGLSEDETLYHQAFNEVEVTPGIKFSCQRTGSVPWCAQAAVLATLESASASRAAAERNRRGAFVTAFIGTYPAI